MFIERFGQRFSTREFRACGNFSAEEVRQLCRGGVDPRELGCPEHVLLFVLEKRAAAKHEKRTAHITGNPVPTITDDDRRRKAREVETVIRQDAADAWARETQYR